MFGFVFSKFGTFLNLMLLIQQDLWSPTHNAGIVSRQVITTAQHTGNGSTTMSSRRTQNKVRVRVKMRS